MCPSPVFLLCLHVLSICTIPYVIYHLPACVITPGSDTTVQDKLVLLYLCSCRFIVARTALHQRGQRFPLNLRGESRRTRMNPGIILSVIISCSIPVCPPRPSCRPPSFPLVFLITHVHVPASRSDKDWLAAARIVLLGGVLLRCHGEGHKVFCS